MVKTYFFPNHSVSIGPMRSQWILSRISCVRVISLGFATGLVDFPLMHAMHAALVNSSWVYPWLRGVSLGQGKRDVHTFRGALGAY